MIHDYCEVIKCHHYFSLGSTATMLRSALFPKVTAGDPQPLVDEARRLVKQRLARPRQVEALRREILSATGASISADVLTGFVGQANGRRPRNRNDRRTLLDWANWAVDRPRCQRCAAVQHLCACTAPEPAPSSGPVRTGSRGRVAGWRCTPQ